MSTQKRVAWVTGASRGIGRACALQLAEEGFRVAVHYNNNLGEAQSVVDHIEKNRGEAIAIQADLRNPQSIETAVDGIIGQWTGIDVLVANAAYCSVVDFENVSVEEWDKTLETNLRGAFLCAQKVIPIMTERGGGSIIFMASQAGQTGGYFVSVPYSVSKAGMICLTKSLAKQYARHNIRVNCIAPGIIDTDMAQSFPEQELQGLVARVPMGRMGTPDEIAQCVRFLATDCSAYITGATIPVNGGLFTP